MTLTVRLPQRVEQKLAEYCVKRGISKSDAVKQALDKLLADQPDAPSAWDLGKDLFEPIDPTKPTRNNALHSKRLLREHFRGWNK